MSKSSKTAAPKQQQVARPVALLVRAGGGKRRMIDDPEGEIAARLMKTASAPATRKR